MELTSDLIALQGILSSLVKTTGEFKKINFRGGNESRILDIVGEIYKFLSSQDGVYQTEDKKLNCRIHNEGLENIVLFLALNTNFTHSLELPDYAHLMNILPPLSKCLFINILCGLELNRYLCSVINKFPLECSTELLEEMVPCLEKMPPKVHLDYAYMFLKAAATKLALVDFSQKVESVVDKFTDVTNIILRNVSGMYSDQIKNWKAAQIYHHMAYCLLDLFELLLYCDKSLVSLQKFIRNILRTCCDVVKNVTIEVYCSWVEVREEDGSLQMLVSNKAYSVIEAYQKYPGAEQLTSMLSSIAKKPLTMSELIHIADIPMMINKIKKNDSHQISWFKALLGAKKFENEKVMECLNCYHYLCSEEDINMLLNCYIENPDPRVKKLVEKCAAGLSIDQLLKVAIRHFHRNSFKNRFTSDIKLPSTLDEIKQEDDLGELPKKNVLLLLDSPEKAFRYIYTQCLKSSFYTDCLKTTFSSIKEIAHIDNIGVTTLLDVVNDNPPNIQNSMEFFALLKALHETGYFSGKSLVIKVFAPLLRKYYDNKCTEELNTTLEIIKQCNIAICIDNDFESYLKLLLKIMNEFRCRFLKFHKLRQMIVEHIVDIFRDNCQPDSGSEVNLETENEDCYYTCYYRQYLTNSNVNSMFRIFCPKFDISDYGNCVHQMIQILPPMVGREWLLMAKEMIHFCDPNKCMELLSDVLILLSQVVDTQKNDTLIPSLKNCLKNYGSVIQHEIYKNSTIEIEANVNKQVCRLLAKLPETLKEEEGLLLISILTERSLKSLANDKEFLCHLVLIKNTKIYQVLAQKISQ